MEAPFRAFRIHSEGGKIAARFEQITLADLSPGEVVIRVSHSGINYKDALAATGAGKILRRYPLVGGIDLAGVVESSQDARFVPGDAVLVTGCALSETHDGGYAQFARVRGEWVIRLPAGLSAFEAMAIGTAGFTAAFAIDMLSARGYRVIAVSGKADAAGYLSALGAHEVLLRKDLDLGSRALETARFGGAIDNLGGEVLTWLTRTVDFWGNIASIGLASGAELHTTVMPFILRGVSLLGINSSATPPARRLRVWQRIAADLKPRHLERIVTRTIDFDALPSAFPAYLDGAVTGRTVVRIG